MSTDECKKEILEKRLGIKIGSNTKHLTAEDYKSSEKLRQEIEAIMESDPSFFRTGTFDMEYFNPIRIHPKCDNILIDGIEDMSKYFRLQHIDHTGTIYVLPKEVFNQKENTQAIVDAMGAEDIKLLKTYGVKVADITGSVLGE